MSKEKILDRVRKLLDKANSTLSEQEAMTFNQKAEELLIKWKIDQAELDSHKSKENQEEVIIQDLVVLDQSKISSAIGILSGVVANHYGATVYIVKGIKPGTRTVKIQTMKIVGFESDIESTKLMFNSLRIQALKFLKEAKKNEINYPYYSNADQNSWDRSYVVGFARRVNERFAESKKVHYEAMQSSTALVIQSREDRVKQKMSEMNLTQARRFSTFAGASNSGYYDANKADIGSSRISSNSQRQLA